LPKRKKRQSGKTKKLKSNDMSSSAKPSEKSSDEQEVLREGDGESDTVVELDKAIGVEDQVISKGKTELEEELAKYSVRQKSMAKTKLTIERLSKELQESKRENQEIKTKYKKELYGKDLEIKVLEQEMQKISKEIDVLRKKQDSLQDDFQMEIIKEVNESLKQKLNSIYKKIDENINKNMQDEAEIEAKARPLVDKIIKLEKIIQQKDVEMGKFTRFKKAYDQINQQNKVLKKEIQKYIEANKLLKAELDKINEELSK